MKYYITTTHEVKTYFELDTNEDAEYSDFIDQLREEPLDGIGLDQFKSQTTTGKSIEVRIDQPTFEDG
jgi:hypothetical protein